MKFLKSISVGTAAVLLAAVALLSGPATSRAAGYQFPCSPWRLSGYDFRQYVSGWGYHAGQDIGCSAGTPVYAAADGVVKYSALTPDSWRWGNLIMIEHGEGNGAVTLYGHLGNDRRVKAGDTVRKGQRIGTVGPSYSRYNGRWAAHLHFQVRPGSYGSTTGTYWAVIHGYESASKIGQYTHPTRYVQSHRSAPAPAPKPSPSFTYNVVSQPKATSQSWSSQYWVEFRLKNTGTATWQHDGDHPVRLGTDRPKSHATAFSNGMGGQGWIQPNRIALPGDVSPGETVTVRAKFNNSGIKPGVYRKYFRPVVEGVGWMRDAGLHATVTVRPPRYAAQAYRVTTHDELSPVSLARTDQNRYLIPGGKVNLKAYIKNTGDIAWHAGGKLPVRLGTDNRRDRRSAFLTQSGSIPTSERWLKSTRPSGLDGVYVPSQSRIAEADTVDPGEIGVFSFTAKAPSKAGTYHEYFRPLVENMGWLSGQVAFTLRILPKGNHYEWVKQDNPDPVAFGRDTETARVYIRNSGRTTWKVDGPMRLGTDKKRDHASAFRGPDWISSNRASGIDAVADAPTEAVVDPGQTARFDFEVKTGTKPDGSYKEYLRPVLDGAGGWLSENDKFVPITVRSEDYDYDLVSQTFSQEPGDLGYGDTLLATVRVRNVGRKAWSADGANAVHLGTSGPQNRSSAFAVLDGPDAWLSKNRPSSIDGRVSGSLLSKKDVSEIKQGETAQFQVPLRVFSDIDGGAHTERFNLVQEGAGWFPDRGIAFPLVITAQTYDYKVVNKAYSRNLDSLLPGQTATVQLAIKNTGRYAWPASGSNQVRLATTRPNSRVSTLATLTGSDPWISRSRPSGIDGKVTNATTFASTPAELILPGETALFSFTVTGAVTGPFTEYFKLVQEGRTWFPDHGLSVVGAVLNAPTITSGYAAGSTGTAGSSGSSTAPDSQEPPENDNPGLVGNVLSKLGLAN